MFSCSGEDRNHLDSLCTVITNFVKNDKQSVQNYSPLINTYIERQYCRLSHCRVAKCHFFTQVNYVQLNLPQEKEKARKSPQVFDI